MTTDEITQALFETIQLKAQINKDLAAIESRISTLKLRLKYAELTDGQLQLAPSSERPPQRKSDRAGEYDRKLSSQLNDDTYWKEDRDTFLRKHGSKLCGRMLDFLDIRVVTKEEIAVACDCSRRTVTNWVKDPRWKIDVLKIVESKIDHYDSLTVVKELVRKRKL